MCKTPVRFLVVHVALNGAVKVQINAKREAKHPKLQYHAKARSGDEGAAVSGALDTHVAIVGALEVRDHMRGAVKNPLIQTLKSMQRRALVMKVQPLARPPCGPRWSAHTRRLPAQNPRSQRRGPCRSPSP